jgi:hypothetical protein
MDDFFILSSIPTGYDLVGYISNCTKGQLYKLEHKETNTFHALRVFDINTTIVCNVGICPMLLKNIQLASISHPNIVNITHIEIVNLLVACSKNNKRYLFLISDWVNCTMSDWIINNIDSYGNYEKISYIRDICQALFYLQYYYGIDIGTISLHPSNLFVVSNIIKIGDIQDSIIFGNGVVESKLFKTNDENDWLGTNGLGLLLYNIIFVNANVTFDNFNTFIFNQDQYTILNFIQDCFEGKSIDHLLNHPVLKIFDLEINTTQPKQILPPNHLKAIQMLHSNGTFDSFMKLRSEIISNLFNNISNESTQYMYPFFMAISLFDRSILKSKIVHHKNKLNVKLAFSIMDACYFLSYKLLSNISYMDEKEFKQDLVGIIIMDEELFCMEQKVLKWINYDFMKSFILHIVKKSKMNDLLIKLKTTLF